jgi:hypothetical protein
MPLPLAEVKKYRIFFFWGSMGILDYYCSQMFSWSFHYLLIKFPMGFDMFPQVPNMLPIAPHLSPYLFPKFYLGDFYNQPNGGITTCLFWDYPKLHLFYFICDGPIKDAHSQNKIEFWKSRQLINMNHNRLMVKVISNPTLYWYPLCSITFYLLLVIKSISFWIK